MSQPASEAIELKEPPIIGIIVCIIGVILLFMAIIIPVLRTVNPNPNAPDLGILLYIFPVLALIVLGLGVVLCKQGRVRCRLTKDEIEFPQFQVSIPWKDIDEIDLVQLPAGAGPAKSLLLMWLTPAGAAKIGGRNLREVPIPAEVNPQPHVCQHINYSFLPGAESIRDHIDLLRERVAEAHGAAAPVREAAMRNIPDATAPLAPRDTSETGPHARAYACGSCGTVTVVSEGSLTHLCNPLRMVNDSICAGCGVTPISVLRWTDTGETVEAFRRRLWKKTPLYCKLVQLLILPLVAGLVAMFVFPANFPFAGLALFVAGFLITLMIFWLTPLAGIMPAVAGLQYEKYR